MIVLAVTTVVVLMGIAVLVESVIIIHVAIFYAIVFHVVMDVTVFIVVACNVCLHAEYLIAWLQIIVKFVTVYPASQAVSSVPWAVMGRVLMHCLAVMAAIVQIYAMCCHA